jgi:hypothetical protein
MTAPGAQQLLAKAKAPFIKLRELTSPTHSPLNNTKEQINASRELKHARRRQAATNPQRQRRGLLARPA